jgi:hypothetical protein
VKLIEFVVPGPILGYRQTTKKTMFHPKERARSKAYGQFKENVRVLAYKAGLKLDGFAMKGKPPRLSVTLYWTKEPRLDWKNAYGALEDSLFYENDRYVIPGAYSDVIWDSGREEAIVRVELP